MIETVEEYQLIQKLEKIMITCIKDKDFLSSVKIIFQKFYAEYENEAVLIPCRCDANESVQIDNTGPLGILRCVACGEAMHFKTKEDLRITIIRKKEEQENENVS